MCFFSIGLLRDEAETLPYPQHVGVDRKRLPSQTKKKEAMDRLRPDALQASHHLLDLLRIHLFQEIEVQRFIPSFEPSKDFANAFRLLSRQAARFDGLDHGIHFCLKHVLPQRKSLLQPLKGPVRIPVVRVLRQNGLHEDIEKVSPSPSTGRPILILQEKGHPFYPGL